MSWKKLCAGILAGTFLFWEGSVFASVADVQHSQSGARITLSGSVETVKPNELIGITVLPKGITPENAAESDILFVSQQKSAEDKFTFLIDMGDVTREVTAWLSQEYGTESVPYTFVYKSTADLASALSSLNAARSAAEVETVLNQSNNGKTNAFILGIDTALLEQIAPPHTNIYQALLDSAPYSAENFEQLREIFTSALKIEELSRSNDAVFIREILETDGVKLGVVTEGDLYEKILSERIGNTAVVYSRLANRSFCNAKELRRAYQEEIVLATIESPKNGRFDVQYVLQNCKADIEISEVVEAIQRLSDTNKVKVYADISGKRFSSVSALSTALYELIRNSGSDGNGSNAGNGGGGSGGSSSGGSVSISDPAVMQPMTPVPDSNAADPSKPFLDLGEAEWAEEAIEVLAGKNIVNGRENGYFFPNSTVTREEFLKMAVLLAELSETSEELLFLDVPRETWFYPYIQQAVGAGITNGISDEMFGVGMEITRQDMAVMIYRTANKKGLKLQKKRTAYFTDEEMIADYAKEAIRSLYGAGIISGNPDGSFAPEKTATRAEAAMMLYGIIKLEGAEA